MNKNSYETDYFGWVYQQAKYLKNNQYEKLDMDNLIEEVESLGKSEKSKLQSHLRILFLHLLKYEFQPTNRSNSWNLSIKNSRKQFLDTLNDNPSLKPKLNQIIEKSYFSARLEAAQETGLDEKVFPEACPWTIEEILERKEMK